MTEKHSKIQENIRKKPNNSFSECRVNSYQKYICRVKQNILKGL